MCYFPGKTLDNISEVFTPYENVEGNLIGLEGKTAELTTALHGSKSFYFFPLLRILV